MPGTTGGQDPISQESGKIAVDQLFPPAPVDQRKHLILEHQIFMDKVLIVAFFILMGGGVALAKYDQNPTVKAVGSGMTGAALGALANRMKDGKLNPE